MLMLKDVYIGETDAKNELIEPGSNDEEMFYKSFTLPNFVDLHGFVKGKLFFVTGLKGTGKTALLRYLGLKAKSDDIASKFVLFKSEITESDRTVLKKRADTIIVQEGDAKQYRDDYEKIWMLFLHKTLVNLIDANGDNVFTNDERWKRYKYTVHGADYGNKALGVLHYFPQITKGMVNFFIPDAYKHFFSGELASKSGQKINFAVLVDAINDFFSHLTPTGERAFIFVDELELNLGSRTQYERDIHLIRDLIVAVEKLNRVLALKGFAVKIICAVRKEVVNAIEGTGKEIAKPVEDFGTELIWHFRIGSPEESYRHALMLLIAKKIYISELFAGQEPGEFNPKIMIEKYFPQHINKLHISEYLLNRSWFRPRDFSRMLKAIKKQYGNSTSGFMQAYLENTAKTYASGSWTEIAEELAAKYPKGHIRAFNALFHGINPFFDFEEMLAWVNKKAKRNSDLETFKDEQLLSGLLADFYQIGLIGNVSPFRFHFRGDEQLDPDEKMMVHRALWPHFSIDG